MPRRNGGAMQQRDEPGAERRVCAPQSAGSRRGRDTGTSGFSGTGTRDSGRGGPAAARVHLWQGEGGDAFQREAVVAREKKAAWLNLVAGPGRGARRHA